MLNRWVGVGRLTADPTVRVKQADNSKVANFTLAVERLPGSKQKADFIPCVAFKKYADIIEEYCSKGSQIAVEGAIRTSSYKDKEGKTIYTTNVCIDFIEFLDKKQSKESQPDNMPIAADYYSDCLPNI